MSKALVKEALDLCNDDDLMSTKKRPNLKAKSQKKSQVFLKKGKINSIQPLFICNGHFIRPHFVIGKRPKSLIEQYCQQINHSNLESNLAFLKKIAKPVGKFDLIRGAVEKTSSRPIAKKQEEEESVFTDADFANFSKSYFNRTEKK
jgi:hypothetical protein